MAPKRKLKLPAEAKHAVERMLAPLFAWVGRDDNDLPVDDNLPPGWHCFGTDEQGRKVYGHIGSGSPTFYFDDTEDMRRRGLGR